MTDYEEILTFVYQTPVGVVRTGLSGNIDLINPFATSMLLMLGADSADSRFNLFDILKKSDPEFVKLIEKLTSGQSARFEKHRLQITSGPVTFIEISGYFNHKNLYFVMNDISQMVRLEQENERLDRARREQMEHLAKIGQGIRTVIHDLRNPIGIIQATSDMMSSLSEEDLREILTKALSPSLSEITNLIEDILDYTRLEVITRVKMPVSEFYTHLKRKLELQSIQSSLPIDLGSCPEGRIEVNTMKMIRVFTNILSNSIKVLKNLNKSDPLIRVGFETADGELLMTIADNGPGIPQEIQEKLFEPFAYKSDYAGNGIGMSIVKQIVENHDGQISFKTGSSGTVFTIRIPLII
jgi:signal transduction histidine kinase